MLLNQYFVNKYIIAETNFCFIQYTKIYMIGYSNILFNFEHILFILNKFIKALNIKYFIKNTPIFAKERKVFPSRPSRKHRLYYFDPLKPRFYIVKLGFTRDIIFLFLLKNIDCGYSLEPPR